MGVQYSKAAGFETIAITHSKDKVELAHELGADSVVSDAQQLKQAGRANVILATTNSYKAAADTLKGLRPDGRLVLIGISDEPFVIANGFEVMGNRVVLKLLAGQSDAFCKYVPAWLRRSLAVIMAL
jgi:alcohol dehydrogenase